MIDPHVHLRDGEQRHKETLRHGLAVAEKIGISAVFDMPNTSPPILRHEDIYRRLAMAKAVQSTVFYGLYCGLSANSDQIREAVSCVDEFRQVVGLKLYAGPSTGDLNVGNEEDQERLFRLLGELRYRGVLAVHAESQQYFSPKDWDPSHPITHTLARPPLSEIHAVGNMLEYAKKYNFAGTLHICHVSLPESVLMIEKARENAGFRISCGATPHHLLLNDLMMEDPDGLLLKVNPPLRDEHEQQKLMDMLLEGRIDWIETDHAPHKKSEKMLEPYASGIPGFPILPYLIAKLRERGADDKMIRRMTHDRIEQIFDMHIPYRSIRRADCFDEYEVDAYYMLHR